MAMDTAALLVPKLGVAGQDNFHIYEYYGAPLANDWNGQAMYLIVNQLVLGNSVIRQQCELEGRSCYYLGATAVTFADFIIFCMLNRSYLAAYASQLTAKGPLPRFIEDIGFKTVEHPSIPVLVSVVFLRDVDSSVVRQPIFSGRNFFLLLRHGRNVSAIWLSTGGMADLFRFPNSKHLVQLGRSLWH
ncbi:hypothetical protein V6N12_070729 [Hibiscus sabdariffa]|uniref:Uncharacterized protein n=1 Tax=Hibiscus sabdariffa TaxID=183260 RepID=A0ABR2FHV6_9ROSI